MHHCRDTVRSMPLPGVHQGPGPFGFVPIPPSLAQGTTPMTPPRRSSRCHTREEASSVCESGPSSPRKGRPTVVDESRNESTLTERDTNDATVEAVVDPDEAETIPKDPQEEVWDLIKIMSIAEITHESPIKCSHTECTLPAAVVWVSNRDPNNKWYSCLDHQLEDFGGWPEPEDLPLPYMTQDHLQTLASHCSATPHIPMPVLPEQTSPRIDDSSLTVTPGTRTCNGASEETGTNAVTPSPNSNDPLLHAGTALKRPPISKKLLEMHRQWQATAESLGGPYARIIVSQVEAKQRIFQALHDAFAPMNINDLHKALKGVVPSPVLKQCLNDMTMDKLEDNNMFADSDDEETEKGVTAVATKTDDFRDPLAKSLVVKGAKSIHATLYYVDHKKLTNNGDGLDPDVRNQLMCEHAKTLAELSSLGQQAKEMTATANQLLAEPTNEDIAALLDSEEICMNDFKQQLENAKGLTVNESHKLQLKRRIEHMASLWRKRKRLTMDFLVNLEESTDGAISARKCLSGEGQIDLESDEVALKNATAYYMNKKKQPVVTRKLAGKRAKTSQVLGIKPTETFIAVKLDAIGCVERVHVED